MGQVGPGLYRAVFPSPGCGDCTIVITDNTRQRSALVPLSVPYSSEYTGTGVDKETLQRDSGCHGRGVLRDEILPQPTSVKETVVSTDIHSYFLLASLALFLAELVWRKLPLRAQGREAELLHRERPVCVRKTGRHEEHEGGGQSS